MTRMKPRTNRRVTLVHSIGYHRPWVKATYLAHGALMSTASRDGETTTEAALLAARQLRLNMANLISSRGQGRWGLVPDPHPLGGWRD